jgi:hypothetical protein
VELYCAKAEAWPWTHTCEKLKSSQETCESDLQCKHGYFCWYKSVTEKTGGVKKCLPKYSQDIDHEFGWASENWEDVSIEEFTHNGQLCKSGFAHPLGPDTARCSVAEHVKWNDEELESPYQCDPTDNAKHCHIVFNTTQWQMGEDSSTSSFSSICKCAMDGDNGFCGSVLATPIYMEYVQSLIPVYEAAKCHTLDRNDLRAHKDVCGIGIGDKEDSEWRRAVDLEY